jgi:hypothetical protein
LIIKYSIAKLEMCTHINTQAGGMTHFHYDDQWVFSHTTETDFKFLRTALDEDLPNLQRMLIEKPSRITECNDDGETALMMATHNRDFVMVKWLLDEGGASVLEYDSYGSTPALHAAEGASNPECRWSSLILHSLLEDYGAPFETPVPWGRIKTVWDNPPCYLQMPSPEATALLRVMVIRDSPPPSLLSRLSIRPEHARLLEDGARCRANIPASLARRGVALNVHCPLIAPLQALVLAYEKATTTEELWATGLSTDPELCSNHGCSGAGLKKCTGCKQARY